ncbi:ComF family protein [Desulfovibrio inopinatus]|uniref:ComF family protein n=1 Tax=Desulfovibrio inopinatus TaxID=102109 RepID=UPI00068838E9|nr:ComF family protein [Desulfovibrio inopinatus]
MRDHILRFKFAGDFASGRLLAHCMINAWLTRKLPEKPNVLVPIPLHPTRLRQRGFNQSLELCRHLRSALQLPISSSAIRRIRQTTPQSQLSASQRHTNLINAFQTNPNRVVRKIVLLIDDVATTNSTLEEAAQALLRAGATRVLALVAAKAQ